MTMIQSRFKSLGILNCISRHLSLVKKCQGLDLDSEKHLDLLEKYQNYALTNLNFSIDRVRYNVKNVFDKLIELYNVLNLSKNLQDLIQDVLNMPWESKSKSIALTSIAKENMKILVQLDENLPTKVANLILDPTVESVATELYEKLLKRA